MFKLKMTLATAAVAITAFAGVSSAAASTPTSVSIMGTQGDYYGYVHSSKSKCESNRTVKVYKIKHGEKQLIGSDIAQPNGPDGMWSIGNSGYKHGKFQAHVKAQYGCSSANSPVISR